MSLSDSVRERIRNQFPYPISHTYNYLESRIGVQDRYAALLNCFEATLKTTASIALANFMRDTQEDSTLGNAYLFEDLVGVLSRPMSLGHWHTVLRLTLYPYHNRVESLVVPELFDFYYRVTEHGNVKAQGQNISLIQRLINERNEEAHHRSRGQSGAFQRRLALDELTQALENLLQALAFMAGYPLFYVEHAEYLEGTWHYRANFARGDRHPFPQETWKTSLSVNAKRCLILNKEKPSVLELDPFMIVTDGGRLQQPELFFFDGVFSSGRVRFMSYHASDYIEPSDEGSPASVASDAVNSLLNMLGNRIPPTVEETEDISEDRLHATEVYRAAVNWVLEHEAQQNISLDALRRILHLSREEALQEERVLEMELGIEIESEDIEVPFEGEPTWANLCYYILDASDQDELFYKDIAAAAEALKDQLDPDWQKGDSAYVAGTVSRTMSTDPRFWKLRQGYYRLTKDNELLSNPSWANLAYFVLKHDDPRRQGMHLNEITDKALALKEKYSDWRSTDVQTPNNTVSATMSMDHRFESMPDRGCWRLAGEKASPTPKSEEPEAPSTRQQAYQEVLDRLSRLGKVTKLPFGRTYYALDDQVHLMFRFSKTHHRNDEIDYFLGVTPQYFERIRTLGHGFLLFVMGGSDNVLVVPAGIFAQWVEDVEPSGSGTWPIDFYQSIEGNRIERWVPGGGRDEITQYLNDYNSIKQVLAQESTESEEIDKISLRVSDLLDAGLLKPGDKIHTKKCPSCHATIIDARFVEYEDKRWTYNDWGSYVNEWSAINIYRQLVLDRTAQTLDELRRELLDKISSSG